MYHNPTLLTFAAAFNLLSLAALFAGYWQAGLLLVAGYVLTQSERRLPPTVDVRAIRHYERVRVH